MFCRKCGKEAVEKESYCTACGNSLSISSSTTSHTTDYVPQQVPKEAWSAGRVIKTLLLIAVVGGIIILKLVYAVDNTAVDSNNSALEAYESGESQQAAAQFQSASQNAVTNSTKVATLINLGYAYLSDEKNDLALSAFKEALPLADSESYQYYLISGEINMIEKRPDLAEKAFNKAHDIAPSEYQVNNSLALFYLDLEEVAPKYTDYKKALNYAQKAYEVDKSEVTKQNLAIVYYFNDSPDQTISLLASTDFVKRPYAAYYIGLAYAQKEDSINAKKFFNQASIGGVALPKEVIDYMNSN